MIDQRIRNLTYSISENNDRVAFDELFEFYFPGLVSFTTSITKDRQKAEEVVIDVFLKVWENRKTLTSVKNFSHYVYTAVKYTAFTAIKKKQRSCFEDIGDEFPLYYNCPESDFISRENLNAIGAIINKLPPKCRLVFRLIKEDGMRYDEVAQLMGISVKTVESQMLIAMKRIIQSLKTALPEFKDYITTRKIK